MYILYIFKDKVIHLVYKIGLKKVPNLYTYINFTLYNLLIILNKKYTCMYIKTQWFDIN